MCRVCQSCRVSIAATLFDMDGLLIDSEVLWHQAEVEIFGSLGVPLYESSSRSTKGVFVNEVVDYWYARYPWTGPSNDEVVGMPTPEDRVEVEFLLADLVLDSLDELSPQWLDERFA